MNYIRREDWESLKPTVYGWGINDVNYVTNVKKIIEGRQKTIWVCPYYRDWCDILTRCFNKKYLVKQPTYKDCSVCSEWKYLSKFIEWVDSQPNKGWVNCVPDKDFLSVGRKHYSPETVVYISQSLNSFIIDSGKVRGHLMLGVSFMAGRKSPYRVQCNNPFLKKIEHVGYFTTEVEAHKAWQAKKHEHALKLADLQDDPRVADALRERYSPDKDWTKR